MHIEIEKDLIPYRFDIELADELFTFEVNYNDRFDFFTIDLWKDGEVVVYGQKININKPLFSPLTDQRLPKVYIIPLDESGEATRVTYENLGETVFLFIGEAIE
jgi:hypothetical protein